MLSARWTYGELDPVSSMVKRDARSEDEGAGLYAAGNAGCKKKEEEAMRAPGAMCTDCGGWSICEHYRQTSTCNQCVRLSLFHVIPQASDRVKGLQPNPVWCQMWVVRVCVCECVCVRERESVCVSTKPRSPLPHAHLLQHTAMQGQTRHAPTRLSVCVSVCLCVCVSV